MKVRTIGLVILLVLLTLLVLGILGVQPFRAWVGAIGAAVFVAIFGAAKSRPPDVKKVEEAKREEVLAQDPAAVVSALDDRARTGVDAAKQAGVDAGVAAAREALHRSPSP